MTLELLVFIFPVVVFFLLFTQHLYGLMRDTQAPFVFAAFAVVLSLIVTGIIGFVYYIGTQFVLLGYTETAQFPLQPLPQDNRQITAYVGSADIGAETFYYFNTSSGKRVKIGRVPSADVVVLEGVTNPVAICERFATHFPRQFNGGDFLDPTDAAACTFSVPSGSIVEKYSPPKG